MQLTPKKWKDESGGDHIIIEVVFDAADIAAACNMADAKIEFTNVHSPGGIRREKSVIRNRLIAGKLADASVEKLLSQRISEVGLGQTITVNEYDKLRSDSFKNPDPYDLELNRLGCSVPETIEVRSSFAYRLAPREKIINKLSIYGWYTSSNKPAELPRDWYWQVVYYLRPRDITKASDLPVAVFEDEIEMGRLTGYIVGGAGRQMLETKGAFRSDQDGAWYRSLFPINSGLDCQEMLTEMLGV